MAFAWFAWQHPQEQPPEHNLKGFLGLIETRFQPPKCVHKRCQLVAIVQSYSDLYIFLFISHTCPISWLVANGRPLAREIYQKFENEETKLFILNVMVTNILSLFLSLRF